MVSSVYTVAATHELSSKSTAYQFSGISVVLTLGFSVHGVLLLIVLSTTIEAIIVWAFSECSSCAGR